MNKKINILYFFSENPLLRNAGNKARALKLLEYFKERNFNVDFVSYNMVDYQEDIQQESQKLVNSELADSVTVLIRKPSKNNKVKYWLSYKIPKLFFKKKGKFNRIPFYIEKNFRKLCREKQYDYIIISYVYNMGLLNKVDVKGAKTIIDTHDFLTANYLAEENISLGSYFQEEINILNKVDQVWAISSDEYYIFSQFCKNEVRLIPFWEDEHISEINLDKEYDLLYVASDNPHNIKSCQWFFTKVYPLLPKSLKILVIGKITNHIDDYKNVTKLNHVERLDEYYQKSGIAICPMLTGTGIKIKVMEALSYGLPVVCTLRGIDGLSNKTHNGCLVTNEEKEFANYIVKLLGNSDFYLKHSIEAREFFRENYSKDICYKKLDSVFKI
ncbi:MAG: glycosyltransferase family 4 protein [Flavobacteriaceae bacterium]|jgi:glycosyltransferase involved in cell wall biosynthesis|nr:glycosyltransferase family 4 protein [Flavobacteriaceae bacterium]